MSAELRAQLLRERANARELNHNSTTSGTDVSHFYELKTAENLKQAGEIKRTSLSDQNQTPTEPPYPLLINKRSRPDACPERIAAASDCPERAPVFSRRFELGPCEPAKAVKIIDTSLGQRKTLQQAMEMMIQAKVFDGSKACITFIHETSMNLRDSYPRAF